MKGKRALNRGSSWAVSQAALTHVDDLLLFKAQLGEPFLEILIFIFVVSFMFFSAKPGT